MLACLTAAHGGATAEEAAPAPAKRPEVMSRVELRQCMDQQDALEHRRRILDQERQLSDSEAAALADEARLLSEQMRRVDSGDAARLATFNSQLAGHNESVKHYNASLETLSDELAQFNADTADVMARCTTRLFSKDDREAILAERRSGNGAAPPSDPAPTR